MIALVKAVKCAINDTVMTITYTDFFEENMKAVCSSYGVSIDELVCALATPSKRYYVRVNLLRAQTEHVIKTLREEGYAFYADGKIVEAIYAPVEGPFNIEGPRDSYVIVDRFTAESVIMGSNVYAPGVLKIKGQIGKETAVLDPRGNVVGYGKLISNPLKLGVRRGLVVEVDRAPYKAPKVRESRAFKAGLIFDQSYPSMGVARGLDVRPRDIVIDVTASPGGKITHAYEVSNGLALSIGIDRSRPKVERLIENIKRLGHNIATVLSDSTKLSELNPYLRGSKLIVDPPCSSLGRRPRLSINLSRESLVNLVMLQRGLLKAASKVTSPGGTIAYSTCTLTIEENENVASWAIKELGLEPIEPAIPLPITRLSSNPFVRFMPTEVDAPGFFIAFFRKK